MTAQLALGSRVERSLEETPPPRCLLLQAILVPAECLGFLVPFSAKASTERFNLSLQLRRSFLEVTRGFPKLGELPFRLAKSEFERS